MPDVIMQRFASVGNTSDSSTSYRVFIWEGTIRMLRDFWYSGIGIGTEAFNTVYPMYALNAIVAPHSHNLYLHILVETGIIGMLTVLILLKMFFKNLTNASKKFAEFKPLAFGIGTAMVGYLIQGMFDNVWYNYRIYFFFFIILAIGTAVYDLSKKEKENG
jgi:O-antigen ligase